METKKLHAMHVLQLLSNGIKITFSMCGVFNETESKTEKNTKYFDRHRLDVNLSSFCYVLE